MREVPFGPVRHSTGLTAGNAGPGSVGSTLEEEWSARRISTLPTNRAAAEDGVHMVYSAAGLSRPRMLWHESPVSLAASWLAAPSSAGPNTVDRVIAAPYRRAVQHLDVHPDRRVMFLRDRFALRRPSVTSAAMHAVVVEDIGAGRPSLRALLHRLGALASKRRPSNFTESGSSQHQLCQMGFAACLLEMFDSRSDARLQGLRLVAENTGWMLPHVHVCWLSDRPINLSFEASGRLHSSSGPALQYGDGWSAYRWKGTRVPRWMIDEPQRINLDWIDAEAAPAVRRAMIEIFTPGRFVSEGGADCVLSDARGTLWFSKWTYRGSVIDSWAAIETTSQNGERIFQYVPAHLRTSAEASAWFAQLPRQNDAKLSQK